MESNRVPISLYESTKVFRVYYAVLRFFQRRISLLQ